MIRRDAAIAVLALCALAGCGRTEPPTVMRASLFGNDSGDVIVTAATAQRYVECEAELAAVRESLRVEREDLIACYQEKGAMEMGKADRVFSTPHYWSPRQITIIGAADSQGIARSIRVDRFGRVVVSP